MLNLLPTVNSFAYFTFKLSKIDDSNVTIILQTDIQFYNRMTFEICMHSKEYIKYSVACMKTATIKFQKIKLFAQRCCEIFIFFKLLYLRKGQLYKPSSI